MTLGDEAQLPLCLRKRDVQCGLAPTNALEENSSARVVLPEPGWPSNRYIRSGSIPPPRILSSPAFPVEIFGPSGSSEMPLALFSMSPRS